MKSVQAISSFDVYLPHLNDFIYELVKLYKDGTISSWNDLEEKVSGFFTTQRTDQLESVVPHWHKMAMFDASREILRNDTLEAFKKLDPLISG